MKSVSTNLCRVAMLASALLAIMALIELSSLMHFGYRLSYPEGIAFSRRQLFAIAASLCAAACGGVCLLLNGGRGTFIRIAAKAAICLSLLDLAIWFISPGKLGIHSIRSAVNECANNLRAVEKAKQEWAMSNAVSNGTELRWEQISSAFPKGLPVCPEASVKALSLEELARPSHVFLIRIIRLHLGKGGML